MEILKDDFKVLVQTDGKYVTKKFKNLSLNANKDLEGKLEIGKSLKIKGLVTPIDYTFRNGRVDEVYYPYIKGRSFADLLNESGVNLPLDVVTKYFEKVEEVIKAGHAQDEKIIFPDILTNGNILYDEGTGEVNVVDFDGLQVGKYECQDVCDLVFTDYTCSLLHNSKYYDKDLFTENLDMFSMYMGLFYYTTKFNLTRDPDFVRDFPGYLNFTGLLQTEVGQKMLKAFNPRQDNPYLEGSLKQLRDNYTLTESRPGYPRQYIKK